MKLSTAKVVGKGQDRRRQPDQVIRFRKLDLVGQAVHTLTSPSIAYLLLVVGLALIVFEFFTIIVGLAGGTGAIALIGAFVGFSHLPVTWWALGLILVAMFGYAIDVQAGRALLVDGHRDGAARRRLAVPLRRLVEARRLLVGARPRWSWAPSRSSSARCRSRCARASPRRRSGAKALIGEVGEAAVDIAPDGVVVLRGARWRARTNRATPIRAGDPIRVVEVDGLVLEVEPEDGGARDYREPRRTGGSEPEAGDRTDRDCEFRAERSP